MSEIDKNNEQKSSRSGTDWQNEGKDRMNRRTPQTCWDLSRKKKQEKKARRWQKGRLKEEQQKPSRKERHANSQFRFEK